jgi:hypothetical protein
MNYMDFNPYLYQERRQQMHRDVNSLRLNKRLRDDRRSSGSRFLDFVCRSALPLLRQAGLAKLVRQAQMHATAGGSVNRVELPRSAFPKPRRGFQSSPRH